MYGVSSSAVLAACMHDDLLSQTGEIGQSIAAIVQCLMSQCSCILAVGSSSLRPRHILHTVAVVGRFAPSCTILWLWGGGLACKGFQAVTQCLRGLVLLSLALVKSNQCLISRIVPA